MVFHYIKIVRAVKIPAKEFYVKFLKKDPENYEEDLEEYGPAQYMVDDWEYPGMYFGPPICCRDDTDFVLCGVEVATIWRRYTRCDECPHEYTCCNRCYGQTDHGFYDFDKYFEPLRECDPLGLCPKCHYDHRKESAHIPTDVETLLRLARLRDTLWAKLPLDVFKIILSMIAKDNEIIRPNKCNRCNALLNLRTPSFDSKIVKFDTLVYKYFGKFGEYKSKLYYVHDDCASCT